MSSKFDLALYFHLEGLSPGYTCLQIDSVSQIGLASKLDLNSGQKWLNWIRIFHFIKLIKSVLSYPNFQSTFQFSSSSTLNPRSILEFSSDLNSSNHNRYLKIPRETFNNSSNHGKNYTAYHSPFPQAWLPAHRAEYFILEHSVVHLNVNSGRKKPGQVARISIMAGAKKQAAGTWNLTTFSRPFSTPFPPRVLLHRWTPWLKMAALVAHRSHKPRTQRFFRANETVQRNVVHANLHSSRLGHAK